MDYVKQLFSSTVSAMAPSDDTVAMPTLKAGSTEID